MNSLKKPNLRDLRKYAKQTHVRVIFGGLFVLASVGLFLIYKFYGINAMFSGLICIGAGLVPVVLILFIFQVIDWILRKYR